jgi:hypothetical protein
MIRATASIRSAAVAAVTRNPLICLVRRLSAAVAAVCRNALKTLCGGLRGCVPHTPLDRRSPRERGMWRPMNAFRGNQSREQGAPAWRPSACAIRGARDGFRAAGHRAYDCRSPRTATPRNRRADRYIMPRRLPAESDRAHRCSRPGRGAESRLSVGAVAVEPDGAAEFVNAPALQGYLAERIPIVCLARNVADAQRIAAALGARSA